MVNSSPRSILRTSRSRSPPSPPAGDIFSHSEYHRRFSPKSVSFDHRVQRRDLVPLKLPTTCDEIIRAVGYREVAQDSTYPDPVSQWWLPLARDRKRSRGAVKVQWDSLDRGMYSRDKFRVADVEAERLREARLMDHPQRWNMIMGLVDKETSLPIYLDQSDLSDTDVEDELDGDWDWSGLKGWAPPMPEDKVQAFLAEQKAKIDAIDRDIRRRRCHASPVGSEGETESEDEVHVADWNPLMVRKRKTHDFEAAATEKKSKLVSRSRVNVSCGY